MLQDLWIAIRGKRPVAPTPDHFIVRLPEDDDPESYVEDEHPAGNGEAITGFCCIISYRDSKGRESERRITCQRLDDAAGIAYIYAYCHERAAVRQFRVDRIVYVADLLTGEIEESASSFFSRFGVGQRQRSPVGWGLSVRSRADLLAGLNALVFMARCDKEWHRAERATIEDFVSSYWLRAELRGQPPMDDIMRHVDRLAPDPEAFFVSLTRCQQSPLLAATIRRRMAAVIDADGVLHDAESFWGGKVDDFFRSI